MRKSTRVRNILIGGLIATVLLGYASTIVSSRIAHQRMAEFCMRDLMGGAPFYLYSAEHQENVEQAFDQIGAPYIVVWQDPYNANTYPFVQLTRTVNAIPYVISISYFWERQAEVGAGATKWYFTFFGFIHEIAETNQYAS